MATYTDNYTMTKPTYAEQADISVINANMDIIDNVMHSSQISLAPAYDINETYNTGDKVQFELLMYKCKEDGVTGAWDSTKWERTTAVEGSGADLDIYGEASGTAEASFSDGAEANLVECIIEIEATQSGSGTPSPSNVRPISGHSSITVTVASTSGGSGDDTTVSLGRTVYGGTLDVTTGELKVTHACIDLGNYNWTNEDAILSGLARIPLDEVRTLGAIYNQTPICSQYEGKTPKGFSQFNYGEIAFSNAEQYPLIRVRDENTRGMTDAQIKTYLSGVTFCYELATPQTFNLTPTQVLTLLGQNYVSHDGGGTISLVYIKKDSTIIPNPSDAKVPLTGLEISGKDFVITDARIPAPPTTNGAYVLTVTVSGGTPTYSWENA